MNLGGGWIVDVDLRKFFDTIDHGHLREFLKRRVRDGVILRLIGKWLNAGVLEEGVLTIPEDGTPQGGVISPLLANIFLHYVLDEWFEKEVRPRLKGRSVPDPLCGRLRDRDSPRRRRTANHGCLAQADEQVRPDGPPGEDASGAVPTAPTRTTPKPRNGNQPEPTTFDFLGFTHYWGRSRRGGWVVKRKTAKSRLKRALAALSEWCRKNRHLPIKEQHQKLTQKLRGHYGYYGITGNFRSLQEFREATRWIWKRQLSRRRRGRPMTWPSFARLEERYRLPAARVVHSLLSSVAKS